MNAIEHNRRIGSSVVRRLVALPAALAILTVAAACRHDGREMRPALPSQTGTVSTTAAPTVPATEDDFFDTVEPDGVVVTAAEVVSTIAEPTSTTTPTTTAEVPSTTVAAPASTLALTAPWRDGAPIDAHYTCVGENVAPALSWTAPPPGTQQIAITMADVDLVAFDHWALAGIPPDVANLAENAVPASAIAALNGAGTVGYTGPCPPAGVTHTYRFTVHYLDRAVSVASGAAAAELRAAIDASTIATAQVTGTFTGV